MSDGAIRPDWPAPPRVRAFVTTRAMRGESKPPYDHFNLGLRSGDEEAAVRANRERLVRDLGLPSAPRWIHQVHGDRSLRITEEIFDREQMADASFTTQPNIVLEPGEGLDAEAIAPRLLYLKRWAPEQWYLALLGDVHLLSSQDFLLVEREMQRTAESRRSRPERLPHALLERSAAAGGVRYEGAHAS